MPTSPSHKFQQGERAVITKSPIKQLVGLKCTVLARTVSFYTVRLDTPVLGLSEWNVSLDGIEPEKDGNDE